MVQFRFAGVLGRLVLVSRLAEKALPRAHVQARLVDAHFQPVELRPPIVFVERAGFRMIAQQIVAVAIVDGFAQGARQVVGVVKKEAAGLLRQREHPLLGIHHFLRALLRNARRAPARYALVRGRDLHVRDAPRVNGVDHHRRPIRRVAQFPDRGFHYGIHLTAVEHADVFGEQHHRFSPGKLAMAFTT